jgi:hypothetical protein
MPGFKKNGQTMDRQTKKIRDLWLILNQMK